MCRTASTPRPASSQRRAAEDAIALAQSAAARAAPRKARRGAHGLGSRQGQGRKTVPLKAFRRLCGALGRARLLRKTCLARGIARRSEPAVVGPVAGVHVHVRRPRRRRPACASISATSSSVVVPRVKPKSYSMSRQGEGEFDITDEFDPGGGGQRPPPRARGRRHHHVLRARGEAERAAGSHVGIAAAFGVGITEGLPTPSPAELARPATRRG